MTSAFLLVGLAVDLHDMPYEPPQHADIVHTTQSTQMSWYRSLGITATALLLVLQGACTPDTATPPEHEDATLTVLPSSLTLEVGDSAKLEAELRWASGNRTSVTAQWSALDATIVRASTSGWVTGLSVGVTAVTVAASGQQKTVPVEVVQPQPSRVTLSHSLLEIRVRDTVSVVATVYDRSGEQLGTPTTWSSSDASVATVTSAGLVTGVAPGSATVHAVAAPVEVSLPVEVVNEAPSATIVVPQDGSSFVPGAQVELSGSATDWEDGPLTGEALSWLSSLQGPLGTGTAVTRSDLVVGEHLVTLIATDSHGVSDRDSVRVEIVVGNRAPTVTISSPGDGTAFALGETITFSGEASDPEDGEIPPSQLRWRSSIAGVIGNGRTLQKSDLSVGSHRVVLRAVDSEGLADSVAVNLSVTGPNQAPHVTIQSPLEGSFYVLGDSVLFQGSGSDAEDGSLPESALLWNDLGYGQTWTGSSLKRGDVGLGGHLLTLRGTDSHGDTARAVRGFNVMERPWATITEPEDGDSFYEDQEVTFRGLAEYPGGTLGSATLVWTSSLDGEVGRGSPVQTNTLSPGEHVVTLDISIHGIPADTSITVTVLERPVVVPFRIVGVSGSGQTGTAAEVLQAPLVVEVQDESGVGVAGTGLTAITETSGDGVTWVEEPTYFIFDSANGTHDTNDFTTSSDGTASLFLRLRGATPVTRRYHRVSVRFSDQDIEAECQALDPSTADERCDPGPMFSAEIEPPPDITVTDVSGEDATAGDTMTVQGIVRNIGKSRAGGSRVWAVIKKSSDFQSGEIFASCSSPWPVLVPALEAGESFAVTVKCPMPSVNSPVSGLWAHIQGDWVAEVVEADEGNNWGTSPVSYTVSPPSG